MTDIHMVAPTLAPNDIVALGEVETLVHLQ